MTSADLGEKIFQAAKASLGRRSALVRQYLEGESEKLAITLRMIMEAAAKGEISEAEASIVLNQQKVAASAVLTSAEGVTAVAVQAALDAAMKQVRSFVNGRLGFALL